MPTLSGPPSDEHIAQMPEWRRLIQSVLRDTHARKNSQGSKQKDLASLRAGSNVHQYTV